MKPNMGDIGGLKKWTNRDRDDNTFLGKYNQNVGGPVLAAAMAVGAIIQVIGIGKELFKGFRKQ